MEPPPLESSEQSLMNQDSGFFSYNTDNLILYALGGKIFSSRDEF